MQGPGNQKENAPRAAAVFREQILLPCSNAGRILAPLIERLFTIHPENS
jgi:hypothetical protein